MSASSRASLLALCALLAFALVGAGPSAASDGPLLVHTVDFEQAKDLARGVMAQAYGKGKIHEWIERSRTTFSTSGGGVVRGGWSWGISVQPVTALTADGRKVSGVLFAAHASHGPGTGKGEFTEAEADKLLAALLTKPELQGKNIVVARLLGENPGGGTAAVVEAPVAAAGADELAAKLKALKSLHDGGLITDAEYEAKRKDLLARF